MTDLTIKYFQAREFYFWKWAEKGILIEWENGDTICYRADLVGLLHKLEHTGFASLDSILLVLGACQKTWSAEENKEQLLMDIFNMIDVDLDEKEKEELDHFFRRAMKALNILGELPEELRKGKNRIHLLHELFSKTSLKLPVEASKNILATFETGQLDKTIFKQKQLFLIDKFKLDLGVIIDVLSPYKTAEELANQLKTGLKNVPETPEIELPEQDAEDLLSQLANDNKTQGLANLTQRLMASLHIPMHTDGVSDQAYGGISDITNQGNFDRLLLSELAYDNNTLMARLVNNEALYYHHEAPPIQQQQHRIILLDSTIKMWGLPRVFGLSAALACTQNIKEKVSIEVFSLSGKNYQKMDLTSKNGVLEAMGQLDGHLDCSQALVDFFKNQSKQEETENVWITTEHVFKEKAFLEHLSFLQQALDYLITVNRQSDLQFYQLNFGKRKLLNSLKLDLKEHLFAQKKIHKKTQIHKELPAFFHGEKSPLYLPTPSVKFTKWNTIRLSNGAVISITNNRMLLWSSPHHGAVELVRNVEEGIYYFGENNEKAYILIHDKKLVKWYEIDVLRQSVSSRNYSEEIQIQYRGVNFKDKYFFIGGHPDSFLIDCETQEVIKGPYNEVIKMIGTLGAYSNRLDIRKIKDQVNPGYSTLQKPKRVYIGTSGYLTMGGHQLQISDKQLQFVSKTFGKNKLIYPTEKIEKTGVLSNANIKFCRSVFADGSEAIVDSRGLLHLRSSNKKLPETTIALIVGQATGAWTMDGMACGSTYFGIHTTSSSQSETFYKLYIQAFIDEIRSNS